MYNLYNKPRRRFHSHTVGHYVQDKLHHMPPTTWDSNNLNLIAVRMHKRLDQWEIQGTPLRCKVACIVSFPLNRSFQVQKQELVTSHNTRSNLQNNLLILCHDITELLEAASLLTTKEFVIYNFCAPWQISKQTLCKYYNGPKVKARTSTYTYYNRIFNICDMNWNVLFNVIVFGIQRECDVTYKYIALFFLLFVYQLLHFTLHYKNNKTSEFLQSICFCTQKWPFDQISSTVSAL